MAHERISQYHIFFYNYAYFALNGKSNHTRLFRNAGEIRDQIGTYKDIRGTI